MKKLIAFVLVASFTGAVMAQQAPQQMPPQSSNVHARPADKDKDKKHGHHHHHRHEHKPADKK